MTGGAGRRPAGLFHHASDTCADRTFGNRTSLIENHQVGRLVITHKDRLLRFGAELMFAICEAEGVEVVILNRGEDTTFEVDLGKEMLEINTVFARLYGRRSQEPEAARRSTAGRGDCP